MNDIVVSSNNCDVCCECINICVNEVIGIREGKVKILAIDHCTFCEECVDICPNQCIEVNYDI